MSHDKSNKQLLRVEMNRDNQSIFVPFDVEHVKFSLTDRDVIDAAKGSFQLDKVTKRAGLNGFVPRPQWRIGIEMNTREVPKRLLRDYVHERKSYRKMRYM